MNDCISRQAVIDLIKKHNVSYGDIFITDQKEFIKYLNELPSVTPTEQWISVKDRLPEIHNYSENYLVTLKRGGVHIARFTECNGKHWWTYDDVVAWMPLFLKPYEPQESEVRNERRF